MRTDNDVYERPRSTLALLRSVEPAHPIDLHSAMRCTHRQADILLQQIADGRRPTSLSQLADLFGITIEAQPQMPVESTAFISEGGWQIFVNDTLANAHQLQRAAHELKHVIDHPARRAHRHAGKALPNEAYEALANAFAEMVFGPDGPASVSPA